MQDFWVELEGDLDPDGFLKGKPGVRNGFQTVRLTPHIKTSSSEEDVEKFMAFIKTRCPVSDVMINGTEIIPADPVLD
jgi:organic hydroperoxide reductase OsmC/OhrA